MRVIEVEIIGVRGSAPREVGTAMHVSAECTRGTIGGGALEHQAIAQARRMLTEGTQDQLEQHLPLGPGLGQCCGGSVTLRYGAPRRVPDAVLPVRFGPLRPVAAAAPLWIWGAGHVGRAVVRALAPLPVFDITWADTGAERFPDPLPARVQTVPASDLPRLAAHAPEGAHHLIFTYSHEIDLALCAALLRRGFASCGLIGSTTKWARFQRRLRAGGLEPARITCPIGDPRAGKHPDAIAQSTAQELLRLAGALTNSAPELSQAAS